MEEAWITWPKQAQFALGSFEDCTIPFHAFDHETQFYAASYNDERLTVTLTRYLDDGIDLIAPE